MIVETRTDVATGQITDPLMTDTDGDGLDDSELDPNVMWFEAEHHASSSATVDVDEEASNSNSISSTIQTDGTVLAQPRDYLLDHNTIPMIDIQPGESYKIYVKAKSPDGVHLGIEWYSGDRDQNGLLAAYPGTVRSWNPPSSNLFAGSGSSTVPPVISPSDPIVPWLPITGPWVVLPVDESYTWICTGDISPEDYDTNPSDGISPILDFGYDLYGVLPSGQTTGTIDVDEFALVKTRQNGTWLVESTPGHLTNPLSIDTDSDGIMDGSEAGEGTIYWFEAEDFKAGVNSKLSSDETARNGKYLSISSTDGFDDLKMGGFLAEASTGGYRVAFRARSNNPNDMSMFTVRYETFAKTYFLTSEWRWYQTEVFDISAGISLDFDGDGDLDKIAVVMAKEPVEWVRMHNLPPVVVTMPGGVANIPLDDLKESIGAGALTSVVIKFHPEGNPPGTPLRYLCFDINNDGTVDWSSTTPVITDPADPNYQFSVEADITTAFLQSYSGGPVLTLRAFAANIGTVMFTEIAASTMQPVNNQFSDPMDGLGGRRVWAPGRDHRLSDA